MRGRKWGIDARSVRHRRRDHPGWWQVSARHAQERVVGDSLLAHLLSACGPTAQHSYGRMIVMVVPSLSPSGSVFDPGSYVSDP